MSRSGWRRLIAASGILFVLLTVAEVILSPDHGNPGDSARHIATLNVKNGSAIVAWEYVASLASLPFLVFLVSLRAALRRAGGQDESLPTLAFGAGLLVVGLDLMSHVFTAVLASSAAKDGNLAVVRALFDLSTFTSFLLWLPVTVLLAATSIAMIQTGLLPRWLGWVGLGIAAVGLVAAAGVTGPTGAAGGAGIAALLLLLLWILAISVAMMRSSEPDGSTRRGALAELRA